MTFIVSIAPGVWWESLVVVGASWWLTECQAPVASAARNTNEQKVLLLLLLLLLLPLPDARWLVARVLGAGSPSRFLEQKGPKLRRLISRRTLVSNCLRTSLAQQRPQINASRWTMSRLRDSFRVAI
uniref:Putative secreted protein n=1 Tax=Anopheles marajoara TaxID=58244 RepID=A0A2M4C779_9DIPT